MRRTAAWSCLDHKSRAARPSAQRAGDAMSPAVRSRGGPAPPSARGQAAGCCAAGCAPLLDSRARDATLSPVRGSYLHMSGLSIDSTLPSELGNLTALTELCAARRPASTRIAPRLSRVPLSLRDREVPLVSGVFDHLHGVTVSRARAARALLTWRARACGVGPPAAAQLFALPLTDSCAPFLIHGRAARARNRTLNEIYRLRGTIPPELGALTALANLCAAPWENRLPCASGSHASDSRALLGSAPRLRGCWARSAQRLTRALLFFCVGRVRQDGVQ